MSKLDTMIDDSDVPEIVKKFGKSMFEIIERKYGLKADSDPVPTSAICDLATISMGACLLAEALGNHELAEILASGGRGFMAELLNPTGANDEDAH